LDADELRAEEPAVRAALGALLVPGGHVDPRRLLTALKAACSSLGVELRYQAAVEGLQPGEVVSGGVTTAYDEVVLASGAWTPALARLAGIDLAGEPVKGQLIRFQVADGRLHSFIHSHHAYLVPRAGAGLVVGSTMVIAGFDRSQDAMAIDRLANQARLLIPSLADAPIAETWTGLRPRLEGGRPVIGRLESGLLLATGHFRNGILLAPITAEIIAALVAGAAAPAVADPFAWHDRQRQARTP
ncbi:MAG: FAD-dependent oxidoreductase, partial [Planctomycetes bacterium]|nr:FAD-dependent oxidoreductase [Planctomycetota bacterium]